MNERLFLLVGEDQHAIKKRTQAILLSSGINLQDTEIYDLDEVTPEDAINAAMTIPFFSDRKAVVFQNANLLGESKLGKDSETTLEYFTRYFQSPSESTLLIIQVFRPNLTLPKPMKALLELNAIIENFQAVVKQDFYQEAKSQFAKANKTITPDALEELVMRTQESKTMMTHEIEKINLYLESENVVTLSNIELLTPRNMEDNIFELINQIVARDKVHALRLLKDLLKRNIDPVTILTMLSSKFLEIAHAKALIRQKASQEEMMKYFNYSKGRLYYVQKNATSFPEEVLETTISKLAEFDYLIKSGQLEKQLALELLLLQL